MRSEEEIKKEILLIEENIENTKNLLDSSSNELAFNMHKGILAAITERRNTLKWVIEL